MAKKLKTIVRSLIKKLFFENEINILNDLKNGYAKLSYSQQCEDLIQGAGLDVFEGRCFHGSASACQMAGQPDAETGGCGA